MCGPTVEMLRIYTSRSTIGIQYSSCIQALHDLFPSKVTATTYISTQDIICIQHKGSAYAFAHFPPYCSFELAYTSQNMTNKAIGYRGTLHERSIWIPLQARYFQ